VRGTSPDVGWFEAKAQFNPEQESVEGPECPIRLETGDSVEWEATQAFPRFWDSKITIAGVKQPLLLSTLVHSYVQLGTGRLVLSKQPVPIAEWLQTSG
jgi:hypothetical protein